MAAEVVAPAIFAWPSDTAAIIALPSTLFESYLMTAATWTMIATARTVAAKRQYNLVHTHLRNTCHVISTKTTNSPARTPTFIIQPYWDCSPLMCDHIAPTDQKASNPANT